MRSEGKETMKSSPREMMQGNRMFSEVKGKGIKEKDESLELPVKG